MPKPTRRQRAWQALERFHARPTPKPLRFLDKGSIRDPNYSGPQPWPSWLLVVGVLVGLGGIPLHVNRGPLVLIVLDLAIAGFFGRQLWKRWRQRTERVGTPPA